MSHVTWLIIVFLLSSLLFGAEAPSSLPAAAADSIRALDAALVQITAQRRLGLAMARNTALMELDAVLVLMEKGGDSGGADAVRRTMQGIIGQLCQEAERDVIDAPAESHPGPSIVGMWVLTGDQVNKTVRFVEVLDGGMCKVLPMTACVGQRRKMLARWSFNRAMFEP